MTPHILLIEQDPCIASLLSYPLSHEGYSVTRSDSKLSGLSEAKRKLYDLIVYDIEEPETEDMDFLHRVRQQHIEAPVMLLSTNREEIQVAKCLRAGAEDYIVKPFGVEEFLARVYAILRRCSKISSISLAKLNESPDTTVEVGHLHIYPERYEVSYLETTLSLPTREFELLLYLAERKGAVVSKNDLAQLFSHSVDPKSCRKVDIYVSSLRKKIEPIPSVHIESIRGRGYKIVSRE